MQRTLISLALVTALWKRGRTDYLDNFVPFLGTLAARRRLATIANHEVAKVCELFAEEFGLSIPYHAMITILNRCRRRGLLTKYELGYRFDQAASAKMDFSAQESGFSAKVRTIVQDFADYAKRVYETEIDVALAEDLVIEMLRKTDMEILFASKDGSSALPRVQLGSKHRKFGHVLSRYVIEVHRNNPEVFRHLADIALGHIITNAILVYDHDWTGETVRNCAFYLDTPILLKLLGADGAEQQAAYVDLFARLCHSGAKLFVFDHTYMELNEILETSRAWANSPLFDPRRSNRVTLYFKQCGYSDLDIEKFILRVDAMLEKCQIEKVDVPPHMELRLHQIGELDLQTMIELVSQERDPYFDKDRSAKAVRRDVASIAAIYRLRRENRPRFLQQARHTLLTNNVALILANKKYMQDQWHYVHELPACVTDVFVGTVLWLNSPPDAAIECRNRLIASCTAAVRPDPELEALLISEAKQLQASRQISKDDFTLLSTSLTIRDLLSDATLNDKDSFTTKTALDILEEAKARISDEAIAPFLEKEKSLIRDSEAATTQRDLAVASIERYVGNRATAWARIENLAIGVGLFAGVAAPLILAFLVTWYIAILSGAFGLLSAYLGFVRAFTFRGNFQRAYTRHSARIRGRFTKQKTGEP